jgi:hypothetical protein
MEHSAKELLEEKQVTITRRIYKDKSGAILPIMDISGTLNPDEIIGLCYKAMMTLSTTKKDDSYMEAMPVEVIKEEQKKDKINYVG